MRHSSSKISTNLFHAFSRNRMTRWFTVSIHELASSKTWHLVFAVESLFFRCVWTEVRSSLSVLYLSDFSRPHHRCFCASSCCLRLMWVQPEEQLQPPRWIWASVTIVRSLSANPRRRRLHLFGPLKNSLPSPWRAQWNASSISSSPSTSSSR